MALFSKRERRIKRVLIVEDEPLVAFDNEYVLRDDGYEVVATVDTVPDALMRIKRGGIDLVLADVRLSDGGSGLDVARAAQGAGIPLMFVTGGCPDEARALSIGILAKPYSPRDLLGAIETIDAIVAGTKPKRPPKGFTLFEG